MRALVVIPARGGSKGIPRKNVRLLSNKPLISYSIESANKSKHDLDVVVSTDDEEIERISKLYNAKVIQRSQELASDEITLDPVIFDALKQEESNKGYEYDFVITMQPTSPLLRTETLDLAIDHFIKLNLDTLISGINKPHLSWTENSEGNFSPLYEKRLNRQLLPKNLIETGSFLISKRRYIKEDTRIGKNISIFEIPTEESIDIDTPQDWWIAEKELNKKKILIRTDGYDEIGLGHIYRGLLLAYNLIEHKVTFIVSKKSTIGLEKLKQSHFNIEVINENEEVEKIIDRYNADILINDILDTSEAYGKFLSGLNVRVVNFEDLGEGANYADAVINDLYEKKNNKENHYWGSDYYCIREEFLISKPTNFNSEVKKILVIFGGTDPSGLTQKVLKAINLLPEMDVEVTFILGMGYKNNLKIKDVDKNSKIKINIVRDVKIMSEYMRTSDIAISSQGRTMLELASMAVPTILLAQNERELHHEFGYLENGFINLGLGENIEISTIRETILWLKNSPQIREQMKKQMMKKDLKQGISRVLKIILDN